MIRNTRLRGALVPGIAAAMLAVTVLSGAAGVAQAACLPEQQCSESPLPTTPPSSGSPTPTATAAPVPAPAPAQPAPKAPAPAPAPVQPAPAQPAPRVAPAPARPAPAPAITPPATPTFSGAVPAEAVVVATPAAVPVTSATSSPGPSSTAMAESSWTKPIATPAASHAAAVVSVEKTSGIGIFGLFAVMGGVLLVGLGGLAFALWSRNRLSGHW